MKHFHVVASFIEENGTTHPAKDTFGCIKDRSRALHVAYAWVNLQVATYISELDEGEEDFLVKSVIGNHEGCLPIIEGYKAEVASGEGVKAVIEEVDSPFASEDPEAFLKALVKRMDVPMISEDADGMALSLTDAEYEFLQSLGFTGELVPDLEPDAKLN